MTADQMVPLLGCVNANEFLGYEPGTLLLLNGGQAVYSPAGWNRLRASDGKWHEVRDDAGRPLYASALFPADLELIVRRDDSPPPAVPGY